MSKHLVLVGGGHAHMVTLANLNNFIQKRHRVTVIGPSDHHYYSGMGPGMLSKIYTPQQIRFATRKVVEMQGAEFIMDKVTRIDPKAQTIHTESGGTHSYDVLSFNAGSYIPTDAVETQNDRIFAAKPIERLLEAQQEIIDLAKAGAVSVSIVGGGAAAFEIAGNAWRLLDACHKHTFEISVFTRGRLLDRFPQKVRVAGTKSLQRRGIKFFENSPVKTIRGMQIQLESGESFPSDVIFLATGVRPSTIFRRSELPVGPDGGLTVNSYLQSTAFANIFGGGDCIHYEPQPLDKVGVYAVRQNPVLYHNLMATLEGQALTHFDPGGAYLLIFNTGDGAGILYKKGVLLGGRLAFFIKDFIDRRFMRKFQAIE